jgi:hypothetical protein
MVADLPFNTLLHVCIPSCYARLPRDRWIA